MDTITFIFVIIGVAATVASFMRLLQKLDK